MNKILFEAINKKQESKQSINSIRKAKRRSEIFFIKLNSKSWTSKIKARTKFRKMNLKKKKFLFEKKKKKEQANRTPHK